MPDFQHELYGNVTETNLEQLVHSNMHLNDILVTLSFVENIYQKNLVFQRLFSIFENYHSFISL